MQKFQSFVLLTLITKYCLLRGCMWVNTIKSAQLIFYQFPRKSLKVSIYLRFLHRGDKVAIKLINLANNIFLNIQENCTVNEPNW